MHGKHKKSVKIFKFLHVYVCKFICKCSDCSCKWGKYVEPPAFMGTWIKGEAEYWKCFWLFFLREPGADKTAAFLRTVQATGVGKTRVYKVRKKAETAGVFSSPQRPQKREPYKTLDDFDETAVRNKVHEFYKVRR